MIQSFSVENFRAFEESGQLPLRPFTCLVGRNSSGKSSLVQALLLLRQSIEQGGFGSRVPQLNLSGILCDAGSYEDIVYGHDTSRQIGFEFGVTVDLSLPSRSRMLGDPLIQMDVPRPQPSRLLLPYYGGPEKQLSLAKGRQHRHVTVSLHFQEEPPFGPTLSRLLIRMDGSSEVRFVRTSGEERVQHWRAYTAGLPPRSILLNFRPWSLFPFVVARHGRIRRMSSEQERTILEFVMASQFAIAEIHTFLSGLRVVGPFRTPPARRYSFTGIGASDAGYAGERAVDLLITENLVGKSKSSLREGVSYWLKRMGLAKRIKVRGLGKKSRIFELSVSGAGIARNANFVDVGFGISQVLPVLIQGFLVPFGGTYVVQQPELHLHPDAQAGLADYFLYLASQGIRVIAETHSEYLLLRLRRRLAEGVKSVRAGIPGERSRVGGVKKDDVAVAMVREDQRSSEVLELELSESFQFENMPRGFMNEAISDRLALVRALRGK